MHKKLAGFLCLTVVALGGCFYPAERGQYLEERLDRLAQENETLRKSLEAERKKNLTEMAELKSSVDGLEKNVHKTDADINVVLQRNAEEVAQLRGQVETYQYKVGEFEQALKKAAEDTSQKASDVAKEDEARKKADALEKPAEPKAFLALADSKAEKKETTTARALYQEFLKKWPNHALAANAHHGLAETFFSDERYSEALYEYGKIMQNFGQSKFAPPSYLRAAECFRKLKKPEGVEMSLQEVIRAFPKSDAAKEAKAKLAEMKKPAKKK